MSKLAANSSQAQSVGFSSLLKPIDKQKKEDHKRGITAKVRTELEELRDRAAEDGFNEGYSDGYAQGQQAGIEQGHLLGRKKAKEEFEAQYQEELEKCIEQMESIVEYAQQSVIDWIIEATNKHSSLAIEIARRALGQEMQICREAVIEIAKKALFEQIRGSQVRIRVNPMDVGLLEARRSDILAAVSGIKSIEVLSDNRVEAGCIVETEAGIVDATVEAYLARLDNEHDKAQEAA